MSGMTTAIIVAAGSSRRMGFNKLLAELGGQSVLQRTLAAFERCAAVDEVLVVGGEGIAEAVADWVAQGDFTKVREVVPGGEQRHFSVWAGLQSLKPECDLVAVHDGARPLIEAGQIAACIEVARRSGAAVCARPLTETIKRVSAEGVVEQSLERDGVWVMETPQVFAVALLRRAYEAVLAAGLLVTDEVSAVQQLGERVEVVLNKGPNPKITFAEDLVLAERGLEVAKS